MRPLHQSGGTDAAPAHLQLTAQLMARCFATGCVDLAVAEAVKDILPQADLVRCVIDHSVCLCSTGMYGHPLHGCGTGRWFCFKLTDHMWCSIAVWTGAQMLLATSHMGKEGPLTLSLLGTARSAAGVAASSNKGFSVRADSRLVQSLCMCASVNRTSERLTACVLAIYQIAALFVSDIVLCCVVLTE